MVKVEIYTQPYCGYCYRAKNVLDQRGVKYEEIDLAHQPQRRQEMIDRADGRYTTPQIFIDDKGVGGSDELAALAKSGELDRLLRGS